MLAQLLLLRRGSRTAARKEPMDALQRRAGGEAQLVEAEQAQSIVALFFRFASRPLGCEGQTTIAAKKGNDEF